ncbi:MAG: right-handed parallel beta-helix repeat-containing protein [Spirulinaceae cyanobacterium SM2_1_0]|nr:right-handed parallel beta-helix repeat-containing protein [Spirulinaceae cyanobacterium SM2_1_0]
MLASAIALPSSAQETPWQASVNSAADTVQPDEFLTLREAILLANGELALANLSPTELQRLSPAARPTIAFDLPTAQTMIALQSELPAIARPNLLLDGTTQPAPVDASVAPTAPQLQPPRVAIVPAEGTAIPRGLTITASGVTVRGFSFAGFHSNGQTSGLLPANILISHPLPPPDANQQYIAAHHQPFMPDNLPPQDVVLEQNWFGILPSGQPPERRSAFGVYVLNGDRLQLRRNRFAHHSGSAIITGFRAPGLQVVENVIEQNGFAGMPDALRLEGDISGAQIQANAIRGNAGSALYLFKPTGRVLVVNNEITDNGRGQSRAAIYLMGHQHEVIDNWISGQSGPGIVVAANPTAQGVAIVGNQFADLQGLSIDLVTQLNVDVQTYDQGDGRNPPLSHHHRRRQTANYGINAPRFASPEFLPLPSGQVTVLGQAEPGAQVDFYQLAAGDEWGALSRLLGSASVNESGQFAATLMGLGPGERLSAIATHPDYGTSEPALPVEIRPLVGAESP